MTSGMVMVNRAKNVQQILKAVGNGCQYDEQAGRGCFFVNGLTCGISIEDINRDPQSVIDYLKQQIQERSKPKWPKKPIWPNLY